MTFDDILEQVITLLKRQRRVSYRALKLRFNLDDEYLDVLKEELIDAQRIALDEDGRILVWIGNTAGTADTASPPAKPTQQPPAQQDRPVKIALPPTTPHTPEAERRQLTVMFCDLVDSTRLSSQLDPEEYRDVVRAYQATCTEVIQRFDGHVAQLLGDGLLVYFGYPQAHEDDAQRAIRTGLGILAAMEDLHTRLQREQGIQLALRMGIHTGLVVVGHMGSGGRQGQLALGETPNVAARMQGLAEPNTLVISDTTSQLVQGYFACQDLGIQKLRGVAEPIAVYRVLSESGVSSRLDVAQTRGLTPLVGRESEVTLLLERWEQAKAGHGQVVLLTGDAGIGKSRLVQMLKDHVANEPHVRWECRSVPYYQNTALYPLTDFLQRTLQWQPDETPDAKVGKLEQTLSQYRLPVEETVPLFAPLLALPLPEPHYPPLNLSPQRQRQKTLETIVAILLELAEHQPVLFIVEDLHWTDPSTLELLNLVIDQIPMTSILTVLTCRPHFQPAWHHRSYITEMTLNHLAHTQVEQIVPGMTDGKTFPAEVLQHIITKTDGVPLFVEEITKALLESGQLQAVDGHYALTGPFSTFTIPATLQDSLMARLDRLASAKGLAQLAAVIGRSLAYDLLQTVSQLDAATLQRELGRLVEAEIVYQRGMPPQATYTFKHALIQDAAYQSLLKSTRQQYHQRIVQVLEAQFPETVETQPELLAYHYTEAALTEQAVVNWQRGGQRAIERSANVEAIAYLTKGLETLTLLSDTPEHRRQELVLQSTLGLALLATRGFGAPKVAAAYTRARELCQRVGNTPQLFPVLWGLWAFYAVRGELQTALELAEQFLALAHSFEDPAVLLAAHHILGDHFFWPGEFARSRSHVDQVLARYDPQQHHPLAFVYGGYDPASSCLSFEALALWFLGYPDQALRSIHQAITLSQQLVDPFGLAHALAFAASLHKLRREGTTAQERAEAAMAVCTEQELPFFLAFGAILRGWALSEQGQGEEGMTDLHRGLAAYRATGAELERPYWLALLAEAYEKGGRYEEALPVLAEALAAVTKMGGSFFYEAELLRLQGVSLLRLPATPQAEAETWLQRALDVARRQQAKSLELRAAMSLARLWQQQGKRQEAHDLLAPVYHWFTEGFDTADLQDAKALLDELTEGQS